MALTRDGLRLRREIGPNLEGDSGQPFAFTVDFRSVSWPTAVSSRLALTKSGRRCDSLIGRQDETVRQLILKLAGTCKGPQPSGGDLFERIDG